uniref:Ion transport domain-containing protein n=1 Tax=Leptocylindrus danicus TaxID=163516 RepID=A0A7S2P4B0_9STRA|mmetsp:Transcript_2269/g.3350  ORF Transcript_2269/g.3350 Transcript_2269/m.3350 type:complete len:825 (+) Transcript_2269:206-2680(+)|eukprot:CAMPEP_0116010936 /NCGR_PEP_ID=MMETSP0321-20121206/4280_1 /TAXON_ID=163516 /ORGANISM="Leptocylindrus danicus var. danicus, Strain B650" /LENGTH=824 /DNA_ID=CAMNT_0003480095 /DNA_START=133 /DNA_END=2607 /DNA_ORIENTATION=+
MDGNFNRDEISQLHRLCDEANIDDPDSWDAIRNWLNNNPGALSQRGAEFQGDYDTTPLHLACRNGPPADVVIALLVASPETVEWTDAFSWLPLHYACANGASDEVLQVLTNAYPPSKTAIDKRGRTPLHFALGNAERQASPGAVDILSDSGAATMADENGSLPLHYACAYGASEEVLKILLRVIPTSTTAMDIKGRTPLHFALGNADRASSPAVVQLLLEKGRDVIDMTDNDGQLPLHLLAAVARKTGLEDKDKTKRVSATKCLDSYLRANPKPTADYLTALQSLPDWLLDHAVISEGVQKVLNEKIAQRFPTGILLLDFNVLIVIIISFRLAIYTYIDKKKNEEEISFAEDGYFRNYIILLILGASYFMLRELVQILSLITLDNFSSWYTDVGNALDVTLIGVSLFSAFIMMLDEPETEEHMKSYQVFFSVVTFIMWMSVLSFLKSTLIDFAVFVGGVFYVVQRLVAFMTALVIILMAFSQMFVTIFQSTDLCPDNLSTSRLKDLMREEKIPVGAVNGYGGDEICDPSEDDYYMLQTLQHNDTLNEYVPVTWSVTAKDHCVSQYKELNCGGGDEDCVPFCDFWHSFLRVYTMLIGEVDEGDFDSNPTAKVFYVVFAFLVVILLANVLIAIVTDSYGVIKNQRAEIVFWSNRLDFVAEMDSIITGFTKIKAIFCGKADDYDAPVSGSDPSFYNTNESGRNIKDTDKHADRLLWSKLMELFSDEDLSPVSLDFWCYSISRLLALFVVFPVWLIIGFVTMGWLWPPQVREWLFVQKYTKRRTDATAEFQDKASATFETLINANANLKEKIAELNMVMKRIVDYQGR